MKKNNPGIRFTDVWKVLVEKWSKLSGWLFLWHSGIFILCASFFYLYLRVVGTMLLVMFVAVCFVLLFYLKYFIFKGS